ncbi:MAG: adenosylcobinamide-phosphate synthase CbiB [bacterium]
MVLIVFAFIIDWFIGDPYWMLHPVKFIGYLINFLEKKLPFTKIGGIILLITVTSIVFLSSFYLIKFAMFYNKYVGYFIIVFLIYTTISVKDLKVEVEKVKKELIKKNIENARKKLQKIVGRDTKNLEEKEIIRACIETTAESTVDGIIAPLFYVFIGGAPLALVYKAINTLDSMVGYKNEKYINFGWASAKLDDLVIFIPARIFSFLILFTTLNFKKMKYILKIILRDRKKHPSPNSGISESGFAGALNIQLGGVNFYQEKKEIRPFLGDAIDELKIEHITKSLYLMQKIAIISLIFFCICKMFFLKI